MAESEPVGTRVESFAVRLRKTRRWTRARTRARFKGWAPVLGYLYVGAALTYLIDSSVTFGVIALALGVPVTWVCGLWVSPRSEDAYILAASRGINDWSEEVARINAKRAAATEDYARAILHALPSSISPERAKVMRETLERGTAKLAPTRDVVYGQALGAHELSRMLNELLEQMEADAEHEEELRAAITGLTHARLVGHREFLESLRSQQAGLTKMRPPASVRGQHRAYIALMGRYGDAVAACSEAIEIGDAEAVRQAAGEIGEVLHAAEEFQRTVGRIVEECFGPRG